MFSEKCGGSLHLQPLKLRSQSHIRKYPVDPVDQHQATGLNTLSSKLPNFDQEEFFI